ncbi:MAG: PKD domain-containing protein [Verrucomicrobiota bacterium]
MKINHLRFLRQARAVFTAGVVLAGAVAATAQNPLLFETNVFYMRNNALAGTAAPYSAGGGVPAGALLTLTNLTSTNCGFSWYGMRGWSTIQGTTNLWATWVNMTNVVATRYGWTTTTPIPNSWNAASFRLSQYNAYVGAANCQGCHSDKYGGWTNTPHSYAIRELLNPDGSFSGHARSSCLPCHTVGDNQPTGYVYAGTNAASYSSTLANVGCENCHGPAGGHFSYSKDLITPAVSLDPAICGSCHQGAKHPTYTEWNAFTNQAYTIYYFTNTANTNRAYFTNLVTALDPNAPLGVITGGVGHNTGDHQSLGCSPCHAANNRMAMVKEYYDRQAGNPHPVTLFSSVGVTNFVTLTLNGITNLVQISPNNNKYVSDGNAFGAATCATCHDPHGYNYAGQLRYPIASTNWYCVPTVTDPTPVLNANGTTNTGASYNTAFDSYYNPNVQVCGQCHSLRGNRWDGSAYGWITNAVVSNTIIAAGYVNQNTYITNMQVFTNYNYSYVLQGGVPVLTSNLTFTTSPIVFSYATNVWTAGSTNSVTNSTFTLGAYYPLIPYTNNGTVYYTTNSSGDSKPHYAVQYNVLIGQLDYDLAARGGPPNVLTDAHTLAPNQCADCHVPSYAVNAGTNVTGHSFVCDYNSPACQSCHASYTNNPAGLAAHTLIYKMSVSNSMSRVVSLLRQWGTNVAPAILATNYGPLAWEYPSINTYFSAKTTNVLGGVSKIISAGPPSAWNKSGQPSGTNDNVQLKYVPQDIRQIRFALNVLYEDQSYGVHNPTYTSNLLAWAENDVITNQFIAAGWPTFSANVVSGAAPLTVQFSNTGSGSVYSWTFGDGGTDIVANPTHTYTNPGLYSVTCTVDGKSLTRTQYILVQ